MMFIPAFLVSWTISISLAAPEPIVKRQNWPSDTGMLTGAFDQVNMASYTIMQDLWGTAEATAGTQSTFPTALSGSDLSWSTSWSWSGNPDQVKSYANAGLSPDQFTRNLLVGVSDGSNSGQYVQKLKSSWSWSYTGNSPTADVAYDMFTSSDPGATMGQYQYEIMVWLAAFGGAMPNQNQRADFATDVIIEGTAFTVSQGKNTYNGQNMITYSFVVGAETPNWSGNLNAFFTWLQQNEGFPHDQILLYAAGGTEAFVVDGSATFSSTSFSLSLA